MAASTLSHFQGSLLASELLRHGAKDNLQHTARHDPMASDFSAELAPLAGCRRMENMGRSKLEAEELSSRSLLYLAAAQEIRRRMKKVEQSVVPRNSSRPTETVDKTLIAKAKLYTQIEDTLRRNSQSVEVLRQSQAESSLTINRLKREAQTRSQLHHQTCLLLMAGMSERERSIMSMMATRENLFLENQRNMACIPMSTWRETMYLNAQLKSETTRLKTQLAEMNQAAVHAATAQAREEDEWIQQCQMLRKERDTLITDLQTSRTREAHLQADNFTIIQAIQELHHTISASAEYIRRQPTQPGSQLASYLEVHPFPLNTSVSVEGLPEIIHMTEAILADLQHMHQSACTAQQEAAEWQRQYELLGAAQEEQLQRLSKELAICQMKHAELQQKTNVTTTSADRELHRLRTALREVTAARTVAEEAKADAQYTITAQQQELRRLQDLLQSVENETSQLRKELDSEKEKTSQLNLMVMELETSRTMAHQASGAHRSEILRMEKQWRQATDILQAENNKLRRESMEWLDQATSLREALSKEKRDRQKEKDELMTQFEKGLQQQLSQVEDNWSLQLKQQAADHDSQVAALRTQLLQSTQQLDEVKQILETERANAWREVVTAMLSQQQAEWAEHRAKMEEELASELASQQNTATQALEAEMDRLREQLQQEIREEMEISKKDAETALLLEMDGVRQKRMAEMEMFFTEERHLQEEAWEKQWQLCKQAAHAALGVELDGMRAEVAAQIETMRTEAQQKLAAEREEALAKWRSEWDLESAERHAQQVKVWAMEFEEQQRDQHHQAVKWREAWEEQVSTLLQEVHETTQSSWQQLTEALKTQWGEVMASQKRGLQNAQEKELTSLQAWAKLKLGELDQSRQEQWEQARARMVEEHERAWALEVAQRRETLRASEEERKEQARRTMSKGTEALWTRIQNDWQALRAAILEEWVRGLEALWAQAHEWSLGTTIASDAANARHKEEQLTWESERGELVAHITELEESLIRARKMDSLQNTLLLDGDQCASLRHQVQTLKAELQVLTTQKAQWEEERQVLHQLHGNAIARMLHAGGGSPLSSPLLGCTLETHDTITQSELVLQLEQERDKLETELKALQSQLQRTLEGRPSQGLSEEAMVGDDKRMSASPDFLRSPTAGGRRLSDSHLLDAEARLAEADARMAAGEVAIARLRMMVTREQRQSLMTQEEALRVCLQQMETADRKWIMESIKSMTVVHR